MEKVFYDVHVFYNRKDGFSVFIELRGNCLWTDEEVIEEAVKQGKLTEEDALYVDYVQEITEEEFIEAVGKL